MTVHAVRIRTQRLLTPKKNDLRSNEARIVVAVFELHRVVDLGIAAAHHERGIRHARAVARPASLAINRVRRTEDEVCPLRIPVIALTAGATEDGDRFRAVLLGNLVRGVRNEVGCLVPGALHPLVRLAAILLLALHRVDDAIGVIDVLLQSKAARAKGTLGDRMLRVTFNLSDLSVLHMNLKAASNRVASRRGPGTGPKDSLLTFLPFPFRHTLSSPLLKYTRDVSTASLRV